MQEIGIPSTPLTDLDGPSSLSCVCSGGLKASERADGAIPPHQHLARLY